MERVTAFMVIFSMDLAIQSHPIENGFSMKFNPISASEDLKPKQFGALFAKIPQEFKKKDELRRDVLIKPYFPQKAEVPSGYTNQVAKLMFPAKYFYITDKNTSRSWTNQVNFLNLPIVRQPYDEYKILVATAPPEMRLGGSGKRMIVYVVIPDESEETGDYSIPNIYFVNEKNGSRDEKKLPVDPILIIDSNRTVTGIKSKEISKYVTFKNKWTNRFNYKVER